MPLLDHFRPPLSGSRRFSPPDDGLLPENPATYAAGYAAVRANKEARLDVWANPVPVGADWPAVPLLVLGLGFAVVELEAAYREACEWERLP